MSKKDVTMPLRELPQSIAAEAAVLGSILIGPACFTDVAELICVEAFAYYENRWIYEALQRISNRGRGNSIDAVLLRDELVTMGRMDQVGVEYIGKILDSVPSSANVMYYAEIVREKYLLRRLISTCGDICEKAYDQHETVEELIDMAEASIFAIGRHSGASTVQQLTERLMCSVSRLENHKVRRNRLDEEDYAGLVESIGRLGTKRLWIEESSVLTPLSIRSRARRLKSAHDIQCIVIDYLQLISTHGRHENRQQEITRISRSIKSLAKELDVPVILLNQLNRAPAGRSNFMAKLTDLRESGSIEQDADVVLLLLHREDYYHKGQADYCNTNVADVIIAKQRNGPTGAIKLTFRPELSRFESYAVAEAVNF
ncbi:MAG: replicative DNA helicase [Planctomycetota bacterium]|jgi:replicative DNA helicase